MSRLIPDGALARLLGYSNNLFVGPLRDAEAVFP